ncbi:SPOR domain-containing protein [Thermodesulfobacteriota bacterium]
MKKKAKVSTTKKKPSPPSKRKGFALRLFLIFFVSAWMFILGIIVGRGTAPVRFDIEKLQKELAALKEKDIKQKERRYKIHRDAGSDKTDLRFYEDLKDTKSNAKLPEEIIEQKTEPTPGKPDTAKLTVGETEEARAADTPQTDIADYSGGKVESSGKYTIQIASFKDSGAADEMIVTLNQKGYSAYRTTGEISGRGTWFRVRTGSFKNRNEADGMLNRLAKDGFKAILIRQ